MHLLQQLCMVSKTVEQRLSSTMPLSRMLIRLRFIAEDDAAILQDNAEADASLRHARLPEAAYAHKPVEMITTALHRLQGTYSDCLAALAVPMQMHMIFLAPMALLSCWMST